MIGVHRPEHDLGLRCTRDCHDHAMTASGGQVPGELGRGHENGEGRPARIRRRGRFGCQEPRRTAVILDVEHIGGGIRSIRRRKHRGDEGDDLVAVHPAADGYGAAATLSAAVAQLSGLALASGQHDP